MRWRAVLVVAGLATLAAAVPARPASAAVFTVNTTADNASANCQGTGPCSIRGAITEANRVTGADTINVPAGSYTLNSQNLGELPISTDITITGASAATTTIGGDGKNARIFRVSSAGGKATISHLRLTFASVVSLPTVADRIGGIILVDSGAALSLDHVRVDNGQAVRGGGIAIRGGTADIAKSSIDHNQASQDGAGILNLGLAGAPAKITLTDSTIASNTNGTASGVQSTGNTGNVVTVTRSTIAYNTAGSNGGTGLRNETGTLSVAGSILVENRGDGTMDNCGGTITNGGGNVENFNKCGFALHDVDNTSQQLLASLPVVSFETPVLPIPATSVAVNLAGTCTGADQRDLRRPQGPGCDAGAYEFDLAPDTSITSGPSGTVGTSSVSFTFNSDDPDATFECKLDGGAFTKCSSPQPYSGLADGAHTFSVRALDQAGQPDPSPPSRPFTVDTTAPNAPVIGGANGSQNTTTVTLSGTAEANSTVTVLEGATVRGTATATGGNWTVTINSVADGAHSYVATARDAVGNTSGNSNTRTITVDTAAPAAPVIGGANGSQNTSTVTLSGTAEANATVTVLEGATVRGTATATGGSWTVTIGSVADGAHSYVATARDAAGNTSGSSNTRTITVDTAVPAAPVIGGANGTQNTSTVTLSGTAEANATVTVLEGATVRGTATATGGNWTVTINSVADGAHSYVATARDAAGNTSGSSNTRTITVDTAAPAAPVIGGADGTQNTTTVTLTGTAETNSTVTVLEGATVRGTTTATGGTWTVTINGVADGAHSYVATARDAAGNTSANSNTRTITVDTAAPAAPVIGGANATQNTSTVTLTGTAEANAVVEVFEGATSRGTAVATGGTWTVTINSVADGAHSYVATARDAAGNTSANSNTRTITVDTVAPNAPVIGGANATQNTSTVTLSGTAEPGATVTVLEGATTRGSATATGGNWTVTINSVADGAHSYVATARDAAGNTSGNSNTRTITVDTAAPAAPVIGGANASQNTTTVTLTGTAEANAAIGVFEGATSRGTAVATGGTWTVTINSVADGAHSYVATARDVAGNTSGNSNTRTITVDTAAPAPPVIGGSNSTQNTSTVTLTGTAEVGAAITVLEGATTRGTATATGGNWTVAINTVADGAHSYVATARDAAGNTSGNSNTRTITVDTAAPAAPVIGGANGLQNTSAVTLSGTAEANSTVTVLEGATVRGTATATGGIWSVTINSVADGAHSYVATARDAAGNTSGNSNTRTITVDTAAPDPPVIAGADGAQNTTTVALAGTAEAGAAITVREGATTRGTATATTDGDWTTTVNNVAEGTHAYVATARDAAGHISGNSNTRTITVDTTMPTTAIDSGPAGPINHDPTFTFHSSEDGTLDCALDDGNFAPCTSPKTYGDLDEHEGPHEFRVRARDAAGNIGDSAARSFSIDTTDPPAEVVSGPAGPTTDPSPAFAFDSSETGSTFECRLDGPGATQGTYGQCVSPRNFSGLQPGDYVFLVRATDPAGNTTTTSRAFSVTVVQQATPTPTPTVGPAQQPTPVPDKTVVIQPVSGKTLVKLPGSNTFEPVDVTRGIPNGSTVDTRKSKIRLFAIPKAGKPAESALFYDGIFKLKLAGGITELQLVEALSCPKAGKADLSAKKPKTRKLWGDGSGSFRTRGQYSAATVRGTRWLVQDFCGKTLTKVAKGVVEVQDFVKRKKILVRAPKSYTAKQKKK